MTSLRRPLPLLLLLAVLGAIAAYLAWSPLGLMEESAGPLDGLLPPDVDAAVRFDPGALAWSPAAATIWEHPAVLDARAASGVDEHVLAPLRALEERVGRTTLGLAPRVERDVLGQEAVVAVRGNEVLILTRLTTRGKLLDAAARLDVEHLRAAGLRVRGDVAVLERPDAPAVHMRRVRDVLIVSTSTEMLALATALGEPPDDVPRGASRYAAALRRDEAPGSRVFVWAAPGALLSDGGELDGVVGLLSSFFPAPSLTPVAGEIDLAEPDRVVVRLGGGWEGDPPESLSALAPEVPGRADGLLADARRLAVPGEAIAALGLTVRASEAVRALADAQPPARRELLDDILAERDLTFDVLAARIAAHLEDGVAGVVSRLPEADALELDDPRQGGVHPIPATLVAFRLRGGATADAVVDEIASEAEALFGSPVLLTPEDGPGGARVHRLEKHRFGGEWALLRPAFAVVDGLLVFCTHEDHLLRALEHRAGGGAGDLDAAPAPARTIALALGGAPLRRYVDDQRWAWADRETRHDWRAEREAIRRELDRSGSILSREDRQVYEDERIAIRLERRNRDEFPQAIERYREAWAPLSVLRSLTLRGDRDGRAFRIDVEIGLATPDAR